MKIMGYRRGRTDIRMKRFPGDAVSFDAEDHTQEFKHSLHENPKERKGRFRMKMSRFVRRFTRINKL
jgi:hypothetical protein